MTALYNLEAEKIIVDSIVTHGDAALSDALDAGLEPSDFRDERHRIVFKNLVSMASAGESIDAGTLKESLEMDNQLDDVGLGYLSNIEIIPDAAKLEHYVGKVVKLAAQRKLSQASQNLQNALTDGDGDITGAIEDLKAATERYESHAGKRELRGISIKVKNYIDAIEGTFSTNQVYSDLGISDTKGRTAVRQALTRLNGADIEQYGDKSGLWRVIRGEVSEIDLDNVCTEALDLWLPLDLHNYVSIMPGNLILIAGGPDSGKSAFLLNVIQYNIQKWTCHYFNSEMAPEEMRIRLDLFPDFPRKHKHFHAYERSADFQDVIRTGKYTLNLVDYLEMSDDFFKVVKYLSDIHRGLRGAVAIVAIQTKTGTSDPLGGNRAMEKARLAVSLQAGNKTEPNLAIIKKCKLRKTIHSMNGKTRAYKLIQGSEFRCDSPQWS
jgi:hypothetical protein